jgi:D-beta-D-heptose 7-phosphate kinase/D-beta-D-heptose 1-phosphate adenosyltransferase
VGPGEQFQEQAARRPAGLAGAVVFVAGDLMLDEYWLGEVSRISPEAPVPVVEVTERSAAPGGAANAAVGLAALQARPLLAGLVGDDANGALLRSALLAAGVDPDGVLVEPGRQTTTKSRLLARGQHVVRVDTEHRAPVVPAVAGRLLAYVEATVPKVEVVVLSDYAKGVMSPRLARAAIRAASRHGKPVVADPAGPDYGKYRGVTVLTPSVSDLARMVGTEIRTGGDLRRAGIQVSTRLPGTDVLITRGAEGMWLMSESKVVLDIPAQARSVYDVTGAGDTVVAVMAVALAKGVPTATAVRMANAAAGIVVGKRGTAAVSLIELTRRVSNGLGRDAGLLVPADCRETGA